MWEYDTVEFGRLVNIETICNIIVPDLEAPCDRLQGLEYSENLEGMTLLRSLGSSCITCKEPSPLLASLLWIAKLPSFDTL